MALLDGARLLASAKRYDLTARVDGRIRRVLGIGAVFTPRELRGRGAASALIAHLVDAANTEGYEFALLFSDIGPVLYERLDFVPVPLEPATLTRAALKSGAPAMLVRAGDDRDLPHITELELDARRRRRASRSTAPRTSSATPSPSGACSPASARPALRQVEFLVAEEGHMAVAYLVCSVHNGAVDDRRSRRSRSRRARGSARCCR